MFSSFPIQLKRIVDVKVREKNKSEFQCFSAETLFLFDAAFGFKRIELQNPIKSKKGIGRKTTYIPSECANDAGILNGSVSFVLSVIIIIVRFQLVHATF